MQLKDYITISISASSLLLGIFLAIMQIKKSKFGIHIACSITIGKKGKYYITFICNNFSAEPYSIVRIDYFVLNLYGVSCYQNALSANFRTIVLPRETITFEKIYMPEYNENYMNTNLEFLNVYTTKRTKPYTIDLRQGKDDSKPIYPKRIKKILKDNANNNISNSQGNVSE